MAVGILLVGGFGTRLLPLTKNTPKPMLTVAGLPVTEHQLAMARRAGITTVVLATSYLSDVFIPYFGDGSKWGMKLLYAVEKEAMGTGGAIKNAVALLDSHGPIVVFNGDVLSSHNLKEQISQHEKNGADVTLHLTTVEDARAYGCVPTDSDGRVIDFLEKMENPVTNTISAGCYVFNPKVIDQIPSNRVVSIERETFPQLIKDGAKVYGYMERAYWLDIGTPKALLQGSIDLVRGVGDSSAINSTNSQIHTSDALIMKGAVIDATASITGGSCVAGGTLIGAHVTVTGSIIESGVEIGAGSIIENSFISKGSKIQINSKISGSCAVNGEIFPI